MTHKKLSVNDAVDQAAVLAGESVQVTGRIQLRSEAQALTHLPRSAWRQDSAMPWRSAIWLNLESVKGDIEGIRGLDGREVVVTGKLTGFDPPRQAFGHLGMYGAEIEVQTISALARAVLHFLCGKAGAGKSTLATRLAQTHSAILISEDIWLARLFGDQMSSFDDYLHFSKKLKTVVGPLVIDLLNSSQSVILDFPANTKASRAWYRSVFDTAKAEHVLHYLPSTDQVCLERIARRNLERPEGSHHLSEADFSYISSFFEAPDESEGFVVKVY